MSGPLHGEQLTAYIVGCVRVAADLHESVAAEMLAEHDAHRHAALLAEAELATEYRVDTETRGRLLVRRSAVNGLWAVTTGALRGRHVWTPDGWRAGALLTDAEIYRWTREQALAAAMTEAGERRG